MTFRHRYLEANRPPAVWSLGIAKATLAAFLLSAALATTTLAIWMFGQDGGQDPSHVPDGFGRGLALRMWSLGLSLTLAAFVWRDIRRIKALDRLTAKSDRLPCIDCGQVLELDAGRAGDAENAGEVGSAKVCAGCGAAVDAGATRHEWAKVRTRAKLGEMAE